jgi:glycosyltransferase involved in cell wall biosynthesis
MQAPVNVLYLIRTWAMGGSHAIVRSLLRELPKDRFTIKTAVFDSPSGGDDVFAEVLRRDGHEVLDERIPWQSRLAWFKARDALEAILREHDIGLLHTHDPHSNVLAGLGRKRWPCACVASPYGWWTRLFPLRSRAYIRIERDLALPNFDRVITVSQDMAARILRGPTPPDRLRVIHTGVRPEAFLSSRDRGDIRREMGLPEDAVVVGTASRIYIEKGHRFLLDAAARLIPHFPRLRFLIVGEGPLRADLERQCRRLGIADRVLFTGYYEDLPAALKAMDVFTLPSVLDEGFPTALLEAQAAGLPVVASNVGGTHETLSVDETGLLVPKRDARALAEALARLLDDAEIRRQMGAAARDFVTRSFTTDRMMAQIAETYEDALAEFAARAGNGNAHRH